MLFLDFLGFLEFCRPTYLFEIGGSNVDGTHIRVFLLFQVRAATFAGGSGLFWDLPTVEKKLHLLLREWDATHPSQVCLHLYLNYNASLILETCHVSSVSLPH